MEKNRGNQANANHTAPDSIILANVATLFVAAAVLGQAVLFNRPISPIAIGLGIYFCTNLLITFFWRRTADNAVKKAVGAWLALCQWGFLVIGVVTLAIGDIGAFPLARAVTALGLFGALTVIMSFCIVWIVGQTGAKQMQASLTAGASIVLAAAAVLAPTVRGQLQNLSGFTGHTKETAHSAPSNRIVAEPEHAPATTAHSAPNHETASEHPVAEHGSTEAGIVLPVANRNEHTANQVPQPLSKHGGAPHWEYNGKAGPENWGKIAKDFAACESGSQQSPIEIPRSTPTMAKWIQPFILPSALRIIDNGHTVQVNYDNGSKILVNNKPYETKQMHYHSPSEHEINGVSYPLEFHVVNKSTSGQLAVLGIMVEKGKHNPDLDPILEGMPKTSGTEVKVDGVNINLTKLLPRNREVYHYAGSLTTPPCSEGVAWNVFANPIQASSEQIERFKAKYFHNNRPVQPTNSRLFGKQATRDSTAPAH